MAPTRISVRVDARQLRSAQRALGTRTTTETIQKALTMVTDKAAHDRVVRRYSGVGKPDAFKEDSPRRSRHPGSHREFQDRSIRAAAT
jgi:hypothetical protein